MGTLRALTASHQRLHQPSQKHFRTDTEIPAINMAEATALPVATKTVTFTRK
jgi:hypothetical protein